MALRNLFEHIFRNKFDHVISLGEACMVAYQIKRYFGIKHSNFFDYKVTRLKCASDIIRNDFQDILLPGNLHLADNKLSIIDKKYQLFFVHEFTDESKTIPADWMKLYPSVLSKTDFLIGRLRDILDSSDTCLFIYARSRYWGKHLDVSETLELEEAIRYRAPRLKFRLLFVDVVSDPNIKKSGDFSRHEP